MFVVSRKRPWPVPGAFTALALLLCALAVPVPAKGQIRYSIGEPTDEEQLYLELINRARSNPAAEGLRLANTTDPQIRSAMDGGPSWEAVDLEMMKDEFEAIEPAPPLSMNAKLMESARRHSSDMLAAGFQGHTGSDGSKLADRLRDADYDFLAGGENVFAYSKSVEYGHAGFEVDWGADDLGSVGGMQARRGHRAGIHNPDLREVGIANVHGTNGSYGPQFVTQDFGTAQNATPFITGVAYYDLNGNNFYDVGEGLEGVTVAVPGSGYYAVTSASGGYSIPVGGDGFYIPTFSPAHGLDVPLARTLLGGANAKADLVLAYNPPVPQPPLAVYAGLPATFAFSPFVGGTGYRFRYSRVNASPAGEGAENGTASLSIVSSGGYDVIQGTVKDSGSKAFHLLHSQPVTQSVSLERTFAPRSGGSVSFRSRLGYATNHEIARLQVSLDEGKTWKTLWSQAGKNNSGESAFQSRSASLDPYAGRPIRLRFVYEVSGGYYFDNHPSVGWYIDTIAFQKVDELTASTTVQLGDVTSATFVPGTEGAYAVALAPVAGSREYPYGPLVKVTATNAPAGSYEVWAASFEIASGLAPGTLSDKLGDSDGDGIPNVMEFAFESLGLNPTVIDSRLAPVPRIVGGELALEYPRDTSKGNISVVAEGSHTLGGWRAAGETGAPTGFTDTVVSTTGTIQTRRAVLPLSAAQCFLRVRVDSLD